MRTMLIPTILLLFCSLAYCDVDKVPNCGASNIYRCFVPSQCTETDVPTMKSMTNLPTISVENYVQINTKCPALLRVHTYSKYSAFISIVSFDPETKSIIFRKTSSKNGAITEIRCTKTTDGKFEGKFTGSINYKATVDPDPLRYAAGNMQCTFVIDLMKKNIPIFELKNVDYQFEIEGNTRMETTQTTNILVANIYTCDASRFRFKHELKTDEKFKEISLHPRKYYCEENSVFNLQYKSKQAIGGKDGWTPVNDGDITCTNKVYKIGADSFGEYERIDIRCSADAKYFCDSDIKTKAVLDPDNEKELHKEKADRANAKPGILKCDNDYPYLFVDRKLILNQYEFKCHNYGAIEYWTILEKYKDNKGKTEIKQQRLTPQGPEAYCAKTIDCALKYKIPDSSVERGTLDNNIPVCFNKDNWLEVGNVKIDDSKVQCNRATGDYTYKIKNVEHIVTHQTKFVCKFKPLPDEKKNAEDKTVLLVAGGVGITVCIGLVVGAVIATVIMSKKHIKKMNAKREKDAIELFKRNEMGYKDFGLNENEKEELEAEQEDKEAEPKSAPSADPTCWSDLVMDARCHAEKMTSFNDKQSIELHTIEIQNPELMKIAENRKIHNAKKIVDYRKPRSIPRASCELLAFVSAGKKSKEAGNFKDDKKK